MIDMERRYVAVHGRRVHYRRAGEGPPLVMLHGSPGNSEMLAHEIAAAARYYTCFAFDTPGFGSSDPLPGETLAMSQLAGATAAAMDALGLPPCPVYGTHTGAVVAIELGVGWPERVTGLILDGLPIFTDEEIRTVFEGFGNYFAPLVPDPLGGHLIASWMRFRDQFTWFPWLSRNVTRLNPVDRPSPEEIDHWVMMFYRSCWTYAAAYHAACYHGQKSHDAATALTLPTIYMASAEDMLYPHLERLPPLKPEQRIEALPYDPAAKTEAIVEYIRSLPQAPRTIIDHAQAPAGHDPAVQFIDGTGAQTFIRCYGDPAESALILLHDAPGSGLALQGRARALAEKLFVIVPDLPGCGESGIAEGSALEAAADAILAIADSLGLARMTIAAEGCGTAVAATLATRGDPRVAALLIDAVHTPDPDVAERIAPDLPLTPEGSHWIKAWLMVRDSQIYTPWFDGRITTQRSDQGNFDAAWLHEQTFEIMKARTSYHRLPREAWRCDSAAALNAASTPVHLSPGGDFAAFILSTMLSQDISL